MWRWVLVFLALTGAAEAGQVRSSFQVGLTIIARPAPSAASAQTPAGARIPLPRPRPAGMSRVTKSQGKPSLAVHGE